MISGRCLLDLPNEIILQIYTNLTQADRAKLSQVSSRLYSLYHDNTIWTQFNADRDIPEFVLTRHRNHVRTLTFRNQRGTFDKTALYRFEHQLSLLTNIAVLDLTDNLLVQTLNFVKTLHHLKTLNISGCGFLDLKELESLHGHQSLQELIMRNFWLPEHTKHGNYILSLPTNLPKIITVDIERTMFLSPQECEIMLSNSRVTVFKFSPRWKRPPKWDVFYEKHSHIRFGDDFEATLKRQNGVFSSHFLELCEVAPFWSTVDDDSDNQ